MLTKLSLLGTARLMEMDELKKRDQLAERIRATEELLEDMREEHGAVKRRFEWLKKYRLKMEKDPIPEV